MRLIRTEKRYNRHAPMGYRTIHGQLILKSDQGQIKFSCGYFSAVKIIDGEQFCTSFVRLKNAVTWVKSNDKGFPSLDLTGSWKIAI